MAYKSKITTYVERRNTKVIFSTVKNAKGGQSTNCKISLPKAWMDDMNIKVPDDREIFLDYDPERKMITIVKADASEKVVLSREDLIELGLSKLDHRAKFKTTVDKENESVLVERTV